MLYCSAKKKSTCIHSWEVRVSSENTYTSTPMSPLFKWNPFPFRWSVDQSWNCTGSKAGKFCNNWAERQAFRKSAMVYFCCRTYFFSHEHRWTTVGRIAFTGRMRCTIFTSATYMVSEKTGDLCPTLLSRTFLSNADHYSDINWIANNLADIPQIFIKEVFHASALKLESREVLQRKTLTRKSIFK